MKSKATPKREKLASGLKSLKAIRFKVSHSSLIRGSILFIILLIAFIVRILPIRWGYTINEFDPYLQYRLTKHLTENGFLSWSPWQDYMSWYPWGRNMPRTAYPGLAFTAAALYMVLRALGVPLGLGPTLDPLQSDPVYNLCVIFPVIMGTVTCLVIYFLGKELAGEAVGLFAAFFLALDSSYIGRTTLGFFDDETVGIFTILLFILFFIRSLDTNRSLNAFLFYSVGAGLLLGYLSVSWGASRFLMAMTALFALALIIIRRYSSRLLLSYGITFILGLLIAVSIPYLSVSFLFDTSILPVYGVFFLLCLSEINRRARTLEQKIAYFIGFVALISALFALLWYMGFIKALEAKFWSLINPWLRPSYPLIESVAEHRPSAWGTFYYNFGVGIFFIPVGLFFATLMATNLSIFLIIYSLASLYFASSMIRLTILASPALCLLWALAITRLLKPFVLFWKESSQALGRRMRFSPTLGKDIIGTILIVMFILFSLTYVIGTDFLLGVQQQRGPRFLIQAYSPTTINSASMPVWRPSSPVPDWLDTLIWMREYLPPSPNRPGEPVYFDGKLVNGTVVASWWDYGYWITTIGNRTSLADNGTFNWTQIEQIALMFMSNTKDAVEILKKYNATHVLVFTTVYTNGWDAPYGEFGKFKWMIKIAHLNEADFGSDQSLSSGGTYWYWNDNGKNTTLYQMMTYGKYARANVADVSNDYYVTKVQQDISEIANNPNSDFGNFISTFELVYYSKGPAVSGMYPLVLVYKVNY